MKALVCTFGLAAAIVVSPGAAGAQPSATSAPPPPVVATNDQAPAADGPVGEPSGFKRFVSDVGHDYIDYFSRETAEWYIDGGAMTAALHPLDEELRDATQDPEATLTRSLEGGSTIGNLSFQLPLAAGWWIIGHAAGSQRGAEAGRDLVRAQISALSWTYAFKYAANRTRPNGDPRSFPSGHASATFATAMVLQGHYGWKIGLPAFAAAGYTAASRITVNKHWASDVAFGAVVGMVSGRTVTLHLRQRTIALGPMAVPGGGGVVFRVADTGR